MPAKLIVGEHDGMQTTPCIRGHGLAHGFELRGVRANPFMHKIRVQTTRTARRRRVAIVEQRENSVALMCRHAYRHIKPLLIEETLHPIEPALALRAMPPPAFHHSLPHSFNHLPLRFAT